MCKKLCLIIPAFFQPFSTDGNPRENIKRISKFLTKHFLRGFQMPPEARPGQAERFQAAALRQPGELLLSNLQRFWAQLLEPSEELFQQQLIRHDIGRITIVTGAMVAQGLQLLIQRPDASGSVIGAHEAVAVTLPQLAGRAQAATELPFLLLGTPDLRVQRPVLFFGDFHQGDVLGIVRITQGVIVAARCRFHSKASVRSVSERRHRKRPCESSCRSCTDTLRLGSQPTFRWPSAGSIVDTGEHRNHVCVHACDPWCQKQEPCFMAIG